MTTLASLKEARAAKTDAIRAIVHKATSESRDITDDEQRMFDSGKADIEKLERDIRNAEFLGELERRETGKPVDGGDKGFEVVSRVLARPRHCLTDTRPERRRRPRARAFARARTARGPALTGHARSDKGLREAHRDHDHAGRRTGCERHRDRLARRPVHRPPSRDDGRAKARRAGAERAC